MSKYHYLVPFFVTVILVSVFGFFFYMHVLQQLRLCMHNPLPWDDRYTLFIRHADFLLLVRLVVDGLPIMDTTTLFTLVDQWSPETHNLHLPCGEATVTL
jgi:hypothetical protein